MAILKCSMSIMPKLSGTGRIIIVTVLVSCPALPLAKLSLIQGLLCTFPLPFAFTAYTPSLPWPASFFLLFSNIFRAEKGSGWVPRQRMRKLTGLRWQDLGTREMRILAATMGRKASAPQQGLMIFRARGTTNNSPDDVLFLAYL